MKLPRVDNGIAASVIHRLQEFEKKNLIAEEYQKIVNDNPEIFRVIEHTIQQQYGEESMDYQHIRNLGILSGIIACLLLESQIEADKLKEMFA